MNQQMEILAELIRRYDATRRTADLTERTARRRIEEVLLGDPELIAAIERRDSAWVQCTTVIEELFPRGSVVSRGSEYLVVDKTDDRVHGQTFWLREGRLRSFNAAFRMDELPHLFIIEDTATIEDKKLRKAVEKRIVQVRMKGW